MTDKEKIDLEQIHATIMNLNAQTQNYIVQSRYEWIKVVAYIVATFSAAAFTVYKIGGG